MLDYAATVFRLIEPLTDRPSRLCAADPVAASHMFGIQQTERRSGSDCLLPFALPVSGIREIL